MALSTTSDNGFDAFWGDGKRHPMSILVGASSAQAARMQSAWSAYHGDLPKPLKVKPGQPDDNVQFNGCRIIVDKSVAFLFGRGLLFDIDGLPSRSAREKYLDDIWDWNDSTLLWQKLATNGGVCGQAFIKIHIGGPKPRLMAINPSSVEVQHRDDDPTDVTRYTIQWAVTTPDKKEQLRRQVIQRSAADGTTYWTITDQVLDGGYKALLIPSSGWQTINTENWPYPFPPIVEAQNLPSPNSYWGVSDVTPDIVHLNEAINRTMSNINRILRIHAHPKTWSRGMSKTQIDQIVINPDGMIHLPTDTAELKNLEMQSDLASSILFLAKLREQMYELSRIPEIASGKVQDLQYMSAMAMQILYGPLIEKTLTKRLAYGRLVADVNRRLLTIAGDAEADTAVSKLIWPEVFPRDAQVESLTAQVQQQIGVSQDTLLLQMGFDPELERRRRAVAMSEELAHAKLMTAATTPPETSNDPSTSTPAQPRRASQPLRASAQ